MRTYLFNIAYDTVIDGKHMSYHFMATSNHFINTAIAEQIAEAHSINKGIPYTKGSAYIENFHRLTRKEAKIWQANQPTKDPVVNFN